MKAAPILIIDKVGLIGEPLTKKLSQEFPIVFVSKSSLAHVPFSRKFPIIPDNKYSHIVVIDDDGVDLEFLPKTIEKSRNINAEFIFSQGLSAKGKDITADILSLYASAKIVLYGDIFDNKLILRQNFKSVINKFIYQAQRFGKIQILGVGLREVYPVNIDDVVDGLIDVIFGIHKQHSVFYIFPQHPTTELSLAHMIQKANPEIGIDFIKQETRRESISYPEQGKYLLESKYPLARKIRAIDIRKKTKNNEDKSSEKKSEKTKRFSTSIVWILIFLIISPLIFTLIFSFLGLNTLYLAKKEVERGSFETAKSSLHLSQTFFYAGKKTSDILFFQGQIIGRQNNLRRLIDDIDLGYRISTGLLYAFNSEIYFSKVFKGQSVNPIEDFTKGQNSLKNAIVILEKIKAEGLPAGRQGKIPVPFIEKVANISPLIRLASNTSDVIPTIFGMEGPKTYLVLFQNNMELRPGGGFIGSYGILKLSMGKITEFSIHDIYDADGQLKGHVEPPFGVRRYLPSEHWYMRDSNFNVDFAQSAKEASKFLEVEMGVSPDGVIGVDVSFVKNVLTAIGPVYVADYKETVTGANLYELTQAHAEKDFFPGSTQKKDFLRSLYKAMQSKIFAGNVSYFALIQAISTSISEKHVLFAFNNNLQDIFTVNGWSSSLWDERKENQEYLNDFLGINEANLGVNKVNYFIKRQVSQKVTIDPNGKISEELNISYKNASTSWPGGDYKNYLRIILPKDTIISEISINNVPQSIVPAITDFLIYENKNFKPPSGLEVERADQDNRTIYGFLVNIKVGEIVKVKVKYNLSEIAPLDLATFTYSLRLFKQPGIDNIPYAFSLAYPSNFNIVKGKASYSGNIVEDKDLIVNFSKK